MTVSARCSPLSFLTHDRVLFREFPFEFAGGDPGGGSGGSSSIAVELSPGNFTVAWVSYGSLSVQSGAFPPPGYGYPAQPARTALAAAVNWWPQGFHHYGMVSWSPNFGVVVSSRVGLLPSGEVVPHNFCYPYIPNATRRWTFLAYSSVTNDGQNPYGTNPNAWYRHLGFDIKRRKDLVLWEDNLFFGSEFLAIYETSAAMPTVRGAKVWQGTNGDRALGRHFKGGGGVQVVQIPWLGVWWVAQISQGALDPGNKIWGFTPTTTPANNASPTAAGFDVPIPPDVRARSADGNLHLVVDQMGRRVFAYQANTSAAPVAVNGLARYPLLIWEVNPGTFAWTPVNFAASMVVSVGGKVNLAPMAYYGGSRFMYLDTRDAASASWGSELTIPGAPIPGQSKRTGGFFVREIFIPKANPARTITWTQRTWSGTLGPNFSNQKHVEMAFNSGDGRMYCFGGDHWPYSASAPPAADPGGPESGSYNNQVMSFSPESGSDLQLEESACPAVRSTNHPIRVDENGFQFRPTSSEFFMMVGYSLANWNNQCGWGTRAEWEAAGGGNQGKVWKWKKGTGWTNAGPYKPKPGFVARQWSQGEDHCRRWYYDSGADKLVAAAYGAGADAALQTPTIQILDCTPNGAGQFEFAKYHAGVCFNGQGGDVTKLPDGRPYIDVVAGANAMWRSDRAAVDPATGHAYVYQPATGDIFRIHTRSDFWNYQGFPAARVDWVCRAIPSGSRSLNLAHFIWARSALWMFFQSGTGRLRVFSWANGEVSPTEHATPEGAVGTSVAKYIVGAEERICVTGNQTGTSWSSLLRSKLLHYYTLSLR